MKINEVATVSEAGLAAALGSFAKSAATSVGKQLAAYSDADYGKFLGPQSTVKVDSQMIQKTAKALGANTAQSWVAMAQQMIQDRQKTMPRGTMATWKDVPDTTKAEAIDQLINSMIKGANPRFSGDYKTLPNFVNADPTSQRIATDAVQQIDRFRQSLLKNASVSTTPTGATAAWSLLATKIVQAATVAAQRESNTTTKSKVAFDKATGKWSYDGRPIDLTKPEQRQAQAEYIRLNPDYASI